MDSPPICCRQFFTQNQCLDDAQSKTLQYKNYQFPYDQTRQHELKKAICGMLNTEGGYILIGIKQTKQRRRIVTPQIYSEDLKENILKYFRLLSGQIKPEHIIIKELLEFEFIPIKEKGVEKYIKGGYVLRVRVKKGDPKSFYYFSIKNQDFYFKRTTNQTLRLKTEVAFQEFRNKIQNSDVTKGEYLVHQGKCKVPERGEQDFSQVKVEQAFPKGHEKSQQVRPKTKPKYPEVSNQHKGNAKIKVLDQFGNGHQQPKHPFRPKQFHNQPKHSHPQPKHPNNRPITEQFKNFSRQPHSPKNVLVLINFPSTDYFQFFKKPHWSMRVVRSEITDVAIVIIDSRQWADFKSEFQKFCSYTKSNALLITPTKKLGFEKLNIDVSTLYSIVDGCCIQNRLVTPRYDMKEQVLECEDMNVAARVYLELREKGIKSRFKN